MDLGASENSEKTHPVDGEHPHNLIKAVIFDCDGTLIDSEHAHYLAWQHALQNQGGDLSLEEYYFYVGKSLEANAKLLAKKIGCNCPERIMEDKKKHYRKLQTLGLPPIQPTIDFIYRLAKEKEKFDLKLAVASAGTRDEIFLNLEHLGIEKLFDMVLSGHDDLADYKDAEGVNKPKPYIYLHAAKKLRVIPEQCVAIEDSASGVTAGVDAGCFTIAVPNQYTSQQDLSHADVNIGSFSDFSVESFLQMIAISRSVSKKVVKISS